MTSLLNSTIVNQFQRFSNCIKQLKRRESETRKGLVASLCSKNCFVKYVKFVHMTGKNIFKTFFNFLIETCLEMVHILPYNSKFNCCLFVNGHSQSCRNILNIQIKGQYQLRTYLFRMHIDRTKDRIHAFSATLPQMLAIIDS